MAPAGGLLAHSAPPVSALRAAPTVRDGTETTPAAQPARWDFGKRGRRKLWDIPSKHHCPVIGTCLEVEELRRIAAKVGFRSDGPPSDYEVHVGFVCAADQKNPLSIATHKLLEKKYAAAVQRFSRAKNGAALTALWREALASGEVPAALWALVTHGQADERLLALAYEDVHMLSHQVGAGQRADLARLAGAREEVLALRARCEDATRRHRRSMEEKERHTRTLEERLQQAQGLRTRLAELQDRLEALEPGLELTHLCARLEASERRTAELTHRHGEAQAQAAAYRERWRAAEARIQQLQKELSEKPDPYGARESPGMRDISPSPDTYEEADCRGCLDLGGQHILCVGGRSTLTEHYRAVVMRFNGSFARHDGGIEDSRQRLEPMLAAADAVVCPLDCVSHDACRRAKRFCKRHGKPCILLPGSSISAFATAVESVARQGLAPEAGSPPPRPIPVRMP